MNFIARLLAAAVACVALLTPPAFAQQSATPNSAVAGPYRVSIQFTPSQPLYATSAAAKAAGVVTGLIAVAGDGPVTLAATPAPTAFLAVQIVSASTGALVHDADVSIMVTPSAGGAPLQMQVARVEELGKGSGSAEYGNNVALKPGDYTVNVNVNGKGETWFHITLH
ncbi:hypothetical protein EPN52_07485 [bacterium]|nr:MAG: hypothetical protein EPN52_07485 [bacterium]